jgi:hypothetical protein
MRTMREKELEEALDVAVEFIEELIGSDADDSETVQHLREMLKKS